MRLLCLSALALLTAASAAAQDKPAAPATPPPAATPAPAAPAATPPAAPPAAPPADATPPATPAPTTGMLSVSSEPTGAKLFLDGADTGLVTPVVDFPVPPGAHTLKLVGADAREIASEFTIEAGGSLNLNLTLPEAAPVAPPVEEKKPDEKKPEEPPATPEPPAPSIAPDEWTWMTVAGWTGLGLGTIGLLSGAVVLTTPTDQDANTLGFGLFGTGVGLVIGGGVLLYLDTELADAQAAPAAAPAR